MKWEKYDRATTRKMAEYNRAGGGVRKPVRSVTGASTGDKYDRAKFIYRKASQALSMGHNLKDKNGEGYACLMDVEDGADGPEYYPAATVKYGFTHVRLHLGLTCEYTPPSGFTYVAAMTLKETIPTGDEPDV